MGPLHPLEYFTESVIHPNAVVPRQLRDRDGNSPMSKDHLERYDAARVDRSIELFGRAQAVGRWPSRSTASARSWPCYRKSQEVVIDHEEIKGFMDAMTMGYKLAAPRNYKD